MNKGNKEKGDIQDLEGRYADTFRIGHSAYKFVLEFGQVSPESEKIHFYTRVIMGPNNAKAFFETLDQSLREYKKQFSGITQIDE